MSGVSTVTSFNGRIPLNPPDCMEVLCMPWVVHRTPYPQIFLDTPFLIIVWNHRLWNYLITPSYGFWFGLYGLVLVNNISFLRQQFINSVPGIFCSFDPSLVSYSGTPSSITNVLSACPKSAFLAIGYISEKYVPLENTCTYWFQSKDFTRPSMVHVDHMPVIFLVWNTMYALYHLARGITADRVSLCVVLAILYLACWRTICHRSLKYSDDTVEWRPFD